MVNDVGVCKEFCITKPFNDNGICRCENSQVDLNGVCCSEGRVNNEGVCAEFCTSPRVNNAGICGK